MIALEETLSGCIVGPGSNSDGAENFDREADSNYFLNERQSGDS